MKRLFDILLSAVIFAATSPLLLVSVFCIAISMGRPFFFVQDRPGKDGKIFKLYKLRTMSGPVSGDQTSSLSSRITRLGGILRRCSIDELPQLWNVLKGDMSLVGPRPLLVDYLPLYSAWQMRRHEMKPGLTGWAQVNGRNSISWEEKFNLDVWYVENQSLALDAKILLELLTVFLLLRPRALRLEFVLFSSHE
jgi:lipopolysaccharide/colanic/teichoic acid biosynthesis glycosyltransferase